MCPHDNVETFTHRMAPIFGLPGEVTIHEATRCADCGQWLHSEDRTPGLFDTEEETT